MHTSNTDGYTYEYDLEKSTSGVRKIEASLNEDGQVGILLPHPNGPISEISIGANINLPEAPFLWKGDRYSFHDLSVKQNAVAGTIDAWTGVEEERERVWLMCDDLVPGQLYDLHVTRLD